MFRRRFSSRGTSSRFRSIRRGRPLRKIVQTARWEVARMSIDAQRTLVEGANSETVEYFHLASIATSFASLAGGSPEARTGAVFAGLNRSLEIGGLVFDYLHDHTGDVSGTFLANELSYDVHMSLLVDRITKDGAGTPFPASVGTYAPFFATFPSALYNTVGPIDTTEPADMPTRILWERNLFVDFRPKELNNDVEGVLYVPQNQRLARSEAVVNRRLKLRLDETQGLYLCHAVRNSNAFGGSGAELDYRFRLLGKLYYRFRQ